MPPDRAAAVAWARKQSQRILAGEFDSEPLGVFKAAERMEAVLTQWQWLDDDFPPSVAPFVWGWNSSGPVADEQIRDAARALDQDPAPDGPPLLGRYPDPLVDADHIADR